MSADTLPRSAQQAAEDDIDLKLLEYIYAAGDHDYEAADSIMREVLVMAIEATLRHPYLRPALLHEVLAVERGDF